MSVERIELADIGGAFNPITRRHLELVGLIASVSERVVVSPALDHRDKADMISFGDRIAMVRSGIKTLPGELQLKIIVSEIERQIKCKGRTLLRVRAMEKITGVKPVVVIGGDYLDEENENRLVIWQDYEELVGNYRVVAVPRSGYSLPTTIPRGVEIFSDGLANGGSAKAREFARKEMWIELGELVVPPVLWHIQMRALEGKPLY